MRTHTLVPLLLLLACAPALAQPFPGAVRLPNGDWVPADHPAVARIATGCYTVQGVSICAPTDCPTSASDAPITPYQENAYAEACIGYANGLRDTPLARSASTACITIADVTVCTPADCARPINLYTQSALATACVHYQRQFSPPAPPPTHYLGETVRHAYGLKGVIIGLTKTLAGLDLLVIETLQTPNQHVPPGTILTQVNAPGNPWLPVPTT